MDEATPQPFPPPSITPGLAPPDLDQPIVHSATEIVVEPSPPPKRRRTGALVGVGAVIVAAVVAGVVLLNGGKSEASYSLQAASKAAAKAQNVAFEMKIDAGPVQMTATTRLDVEQQLMAMSATMPITADAGSIEAIIDVGNKVMYMDASAFPGAGELPTKWISMDLSKVPGAADSFGGLTGTNPLDTAGLFRDATTVKDEGLEDLNGEQVKHYVVTIDTAEALAAQPDLFDQIDDLGATLPDTIDYDVWVTEDNQLRRMSFTMDVAAQTMVVDMTVTAIGTIEPIVVPADAEVTDMTDLLPES